MHIEQHTILEGLVCRYSGIDAGSKVRYLLDGIRTTELDSVKTQVLSSPALQMDFDSCITLYKDFIEAREATAGRTLNISEVCTQDNKVNKKRKVQFDDVEDRYYSAKEYSRLSSEQKNKLQKLRTTRKVDTGASKDKSNINLSKKSIKVLATAIAKCQDNNDVNSDNKGEEGPQNPNNNRTNPALTRQKKRD